MWGTFVQAIIYPIQAPLERSENAQLIFRLRLTTILWLDGYLKGGILILLGLCLLAAAVYILEPPEQTEVVVHVDKIGVSLHPNPMGPWRIIVR
jgi:hypothetical protein